MNRRLQIAPPPADEPAPSLEDEIQLLLVRRRQALQAVAWAEQELMPLRKRYAEERGEFMLPTIERLNRELMA